MVISCISAVPAQAGTAGDAAREKAWDNMWKQATIFWSPSSTIEYEHSSDQLSGSKFYAGFAYVGIPYTQSMSSLSRNISAFQGVMTDGRYGNFNSWVPTTALTTFEKTYLSSGKTGTAKVDTIDIIMGNDCSSACYWALATVANVTFAGTSSMYPANNTGLKFVETDNVKPSEMTAIANEKSYSCDIMQGGALGTKTNNYTGSVDDLLDKNQMFELYAAMGKGDVLVSNFLGGTLEGQSAGDYHHSFMVEKVDKVNKQVLILQHGGMGDSSQGTNCNNDLLCGKNMSNSQITWTDGDGNSHTADGKILWNYGWVSFEFLNSHYYVPLTLDEYEDGAKEGAATVDNDLKGSLYLAYGTVSSTSLRLESVNITIKSADGESTIGSTTLYTDTYRYGLFKGQGSQRLTENTMNLDTFAQYIATYGMQRGEEYLYTLTANMADGTSQILKNYTFVY